MLFLRAQGGLSRQGEPRQLGETVGTPLSTAPRPPRLLRIAVFVFIVKNVTWVPTRKTSRITSVYWNINPPFWASSPACKLLPFGILKKKKESLEVCERPSCMATARTGAAFHGSGPGARPREQAFFVNTPLSGPALWVAADHVGRLPESKLPHGKIRVSQKPSSLH